MSDEIKPVLGLVEWTYEKERIARQRGLSTPDELAWMVAVGNEELPDEDPRKITRADVEVVKRAAAACEYMPSGEDDVIGPFHESLLSVAAKLNALLPPAP